MINSDVAQNDAVIYRCQLDVAIVRIFTYGEDMEELVTILLDSFKWNKYGKFGDWLTLEDISNQLKERLERVGVIYVWVEVPLEGQIYQFGNYDKHMWWLCGETIGYA